MAKSFFINDKIKEHIIVLKKQYIYTAITTIMAIIIGVIICLTDYNYVSILKDTDKVLMDYITANVEYGTVFVSKIKDILFCLILIFCFNLSIYTSIFSYLFVGYQMVMIVLSASAVISLFGFVGILIFIFYIIPLNIINYFFITLFNNVCVKRAEISQKYKTGFINSFKEYNICIYLVISLLGLFLVCFISSFIIPLIIKNFAIIIY